MLLGQVNQLLVLNFTCANYYHVLSKVVSSVKVYNHVAINRAYVVNIAKNRLSHHMLPIDVVIYILHQCLF